MSKPDYFKQARKEIKGHTKNSVKRAIYDFKKSLDRSQRISYANTCYNIGVAYHLLFAITRIEMYCDKALYFYRRSLRNINRINLTDVYNNMCSLYKNLFRLTPSRKDYLDQAFKCINSSIRLMGDVKSSGPYVNKARLLMMKGHIFNNHALYRDAIQIYEYLSKEDPYNSDTHDLDESLAVSKLLSNDFSNNKEWVLHHVNKTINPFSKENINLLSKDNVINIENFLGNCLSYLSNHLVKLNEQTRDIYLYQYTNTSTLGNICGLNNNINPRPNSQVFQLRLYNSDYMNDPMEGKTLLHKLIGLEAGNSTKINQIEAILNTLYPHNLRNLHAGHVYMASLSSVNPFSYDSMPLWNLYADNHKGIVMGMSFDGIEQSEYGFHPAHSRMVVNGINYFRNKRNVHKNKIPLKIYKMSYDVNDIHNINNLKNEYKRSNGEKQQQIWLRIKNAIYLASLSIITSSFSSKVLKKDKHLRYIIRYNLDRIRFLLKSGVYKYEQEYRVMENDPNYNETHYDPGNEKLFVSLDKNSSINANLKELVFGSRCKSNYWLPFVERQLGTKIKLEKSNINYR